MLVALLAMVAVQTYARPCSADAIVLQVGKRRPLVGAVDPHMKLMTPDGPYAIVLSGGKWSVFAARSA